MSAMSVNITQQGGSLRAARKAAGLSQQRVAELAGCSLTYVRVLESGYTPRDAGSKVFCRILNVLQKERSPVATPDSSDKLGEENADHAAVTA